MSVPAMTSPHSLEHEQSVLGGLLLNPDSIDRITLDGAEFYFDCHKTIFDAIRAILSAGDPLDVLILAERLEREGTLEKVGGLAYLGALMQNTPSAANINHYSRTVQHKAIERRLLAVSEDIRVLALSHKEAPSKIIEAQDLMQAMSESCQSDRQFFLLEDVLKRAVEGIDERFHRDGEIMGLPTGFTDLDQKTCGLQRGDLILVAGRPGMGKTAFSLNIGENMAAAGGKGAVFSLEMGSEQLVNRMISGVGRIDSQRLRSGKLQDEDWGKLTYAVSKLMEMSIWIDETPGATPADIRAGVRKAKRSMGGLDWIIVDYLQLMGSGSNKSEHRAMELSEISRALKSLAKEFNVPVIALSQLNRSLEQRPNKRPVMSDLRESGALEQDADVILFIYRDEVYNEDSQDKGTAEIIIAKQRNGPIGTVRLAYMGEFTRFGNFARY